MQHDNEAIFGLWPGNLSNTKFERSLYFDGSNDYVDIGKTDLAGSWTAAMWIKREDSANVAATVMHSSFNSLRVEQYNNSSKAGFTRVGIADKTFNYSAPIGTWVHLAYVGTPTGTSLYVNGVLLETIDYSIGCPMDKLGCDYDSFKGYLDDVKIFNRALSSSEISSLAQ